MTDGRPERGTPEDDIYRRIMAAMSRAGRKVEINRCLHLARLVQKIGHREKEVQRIAREMGLDPKYLPRKTV